MEDSSNPQSLFSPVNTTRFDFRNSILFKLLLTIGLALVLLIPSTMIRKLVEERQARSIEATEEVSGKWGAAQVIGGPILTLPVKDGFGLRFAHILPAQLTFKGDLDPEVRHRGIFDVVLYTGMLNISGTFSSASLDALGIDPKNVLWKDAYLSIGIPDLHGVNDSIQLDWNGGKIPFTPGLTSDDVYTSGARVMLGQAGLTSLEAVNRFAMNLNINGSSSFKIMPLGKTTMMELRSKWSDPSFTGAFLPDTREVSDNGFTASWKVLDLNRNIPAQWFNRGPSLEGTEFGVELKLPVDHYQQSERSTKYAIMFIGLTFLAFLLIEIMNKTKLHPIQYLLVGLALVIFYLLLLSLSEQLRFGIAYLIASAAVIGIVSLYMASIIKRRKVTAILSALMTGLYGYLYVLLQLEDWSLMMGSIGLFIILAVIMFLTRKINWYDMALRSEQKGTESTVPA